MFDYDEFDQNISAIGSLHGDLVHEIFNAVHDAEDEEDFEQIQATLRELLVGVESLYSSIGGLIRFADQRQVDQEMNFITDVRKTINALPLYKAPAKKVGCPTCLGGRRKLTGPCQSCNGAGTIPALPRSRAEG